MLREITAKEAVLMGLEGNTVLVVSRESLLEMGAYDFDTIAGGKLMFLAEENTAESIERLYKSGKSMEEISGLLGISLAEVSRVIDRLGLGKERYKGETIPSKGSAPVKSCMVGR